MRKLGKSRQAMLRLAERHWKFLNEFGLLGTVRKACMVNGGRPTEELFFSLLGALPHLEVGDADG